MAQVHGEHSCGLLSIRAQFKHPQVPSMSHCPLPLWCPGSVGTGVLWKTVTGAAHEQQAVCQPLPPSPCACLDRHPHIQPQSNAGGSKRVPTAPCPHRALLVMRNHQAHQISRHFLCVCPLTQQLYMYTPWWCVCLCEPQTPLQQLCTL